MFFGLDLQQCLTSNLVFLTMNPVNFATDSFVQTSLSLVPVPQPVEGCPFKAKQPGTPQTLNVAIGRVMFPASYRHFDTLGYHSVVLTWPTLGSNMNSVVSWVELRWMTSVAPSSPAPQVFQQGAINPDNLSDRYMSSINQNRDGDIVVGYSTSSSTVFPGLRFAFRRRTDPLGVMTEVVAVDGTLSQTVTDRWGDYASMSVDPIDDSTFFYTNQVIQAAPNTWSTKVVSIAMTAPVAGSTGATGASGAMGPTGSPGTTGAMGPSGATGTTGAAGASGTTGATGAAGQNGSPGAPGPSGSSGSSGATGAPGTPGSSGTTGATGARGQMGFTGPSGASGTSGGTGAAGKSGATGATGAPGGPGPQGFSGTTGTTGAMGLNGPSGMTGASGASGTSGATGGTGRPGSTGAVGTSGATGSTGAQGVAGAPGSSGTTGAVGSSGSTGSTGAAGASGTSGATGATGAPGLQQADASVAPWLNMGRPLSVTADPLATPSCYANIFGEVSLRGLLQIGTSPSPGRVVALFPRSSATGQCDCSPGTRDVVVTTSALLPSNEACMVRLAVVKVLNVDVNSNGLVDAVDETLIFTDTSFDTNVSAVFSKCNPVLGCGRADVNGDGKVNQKDVDILKDSLAFGTSTACGGIFIAHINCFGNGGGELASLSGLALDSITYFHQDGMTSSVIPTKRYEYLDSLAGKVSIIEQRSQNLQEQNQWLISQLLSLRNKDIEHEEKLDDTHRFLNSNVVVDLFVCLALLTVGAVVVALLTRKWRK